MKIQLTTTIQTADGATDVRPPVTLLETAAAREAAREAFEAIIPGLGAIVAIPPAAHEANLKLLLVRDLAAHGITAGPAEGAEALTLRVIRAPHAEAPGGSAEVYALRYELA